MRSNAVNSLGYVYSGGDIRNIYILLLLSLSYSQPATEWTQVNISSNQNIVKLISDGNGLYGATSTASIYFSSNNGLNWESLPLHPDIFPYGVIYLIK